MSQRIIKKKITANNLFDCSDLSNFISSIVQVLPYKGISMSRFYLCDVGGVRFLTKMCFYRKTAIEIYGAPPDTVIPHIDAEMNILRIFNEKIVARNISPCIIELVYSRICTGLEGLITKKTDCTESNEHDSSPEYDVITQLCRYNDLIKNDLAHDKYAFLVLDMCDMSLDEYLHKGTNSPINIVVFKSLLFQIVYTMYAITTIYPGFRHFDLHTENIMLKFDTSYRFKSNDPKFMVFNIAGTKYTVPYFGIVAKIIDFGFSSLPEEGIVSNATEDKERMYFRAQNDLLLLFHWIHFRLRHVAGDKPNYVDKLLQSLEPNRSYVQYHTEHIRKIEGEIPTYEQMIKNDVWHEYTEYSVPKKQIYSEFASIGH